MKIFELVNIVTPSTNTRLIVMDGTDRKAEVRCHFGNIPKAFWESSVKSIYLERLSDGTGLIETYLEVIIDM